MTDNMYVLCPEDGEFISYGKEIELYLNLLDAVATLHFIIDKQELFRTVLIRRMGLHEGDEPMMNKDVSKEYLEIAKEDQL